MRDRFRAAVAAGAVCAFGTTAHANVIYAPGASSFSATSYIASAPGVFEEDREWSQSLTPLYAGFDSYIESLGIAARSAIEVSNEWNDAQQRLDVNLAMSASLARTGPVVPIREAQGSTTYFAVSFLTLTEAASLRFRANAHGDDMDFPFAVSVYSEHEDGYVAEFGINAGDSIDSTLRLDAGVYRLYIDALLYQIAWNANASIDGSTAASMLLAVAVVPAPFTAVAFAPLAMLAARRRR